MKINTVTFDDDGTPLSCDVTMSLTEAAMLTNLLGKVTDITPTAAFAFAQLDGLFNGLYKDGIETYRQKNKGCWHALTLPLDAPAVTVTRSAPQPQSGDLWEHPTYGRMLFTDFSGDLWAWDMQESGHALSGLDMSGANRLYPPWNDTDNR